MISSADTSKMDSNIIYDSMGEMLPIFAVGSKLW